MRDFYQVDEQEQCLRLERLAQKALQYWRLGDHAELKLLKYRENAVFAVQTEEGRFALRVHRAGYHSDEALQSELQWMSAMKSGGILTPEVIPSFEGDLFVVVSHPDVSEPRQIDVLSWVDGDALGSIEAGASGEVQKVVANYRIVGELMARLHNQAQRWEKPEGFTRHAWDIDGLLGDDPLWGRFWELDMLSADQLELIQQARIKLRDALLAFGQGEDRYGLIHCDFLPENLLCGSDGIRLIDFDDSGFGWHLFDIVTSLFFLTGEPIFEQVKQALIDGYRSQRALPNSHLALLPEFFLLRGLTYLGWVHTRSETDTAKMLAPQLAASVSALAREYLEEPHK